MRRLLVAALCAALVGFPSVAAEGAPAPLPGATAGKLLPGVPEPDHLVGSTLDGAAPDLALVSDGPTSPDRPRPSQLRRLSTGGTVLRDLPNIAVWNSGNRPQLVLGSLLTPNADSLAQWSISSVTVSDAVTGRQTLVLRTPVGDSFVGAGPSWLLSYSSVVHLTRADGSWALSDVPVLHSLEVLDQDATSVLLRADRSSLYLLDLATRKSRLVADSGVDPGSNDTRLTAHRIIWRHLGSPAGVNTTLDWQPRGGGAIQNVELSQRGTVMALGDDVVLVDGCCNQSTVTPVKLATGAVGAPLTTAASEVSSTQDGGLTALLSDEPTGRLVTISPVGVLRTVRVLDRHFRPARLAALAGSRVVAQYGSNSGYTAAGAPMLSSVSGGAWSAFAVVDQTPGDQELVAAAGDVVLTHTTTRHGASEPDRYVLTWPGGSRKVGAWYESARLGTGGRLLSRMAVDNGPVVIENAKTGAALFSLPDEQFALDQGWVWRGPDSSGRITGTDLLDGGKTRTISGAGCAAGVVTSGLQVVGRSAVVFCLDGQWRVVDVSGDKASAAAWTRPAVGESFSVGAGFAAWTQRVSNSLYVAVQDLVAPSHPVRYYGQARSDSQRPGLDFSVDASGGRGLIYVDDFGRVRSVDLAWLAKRPDAAAVPVPSLASQPRVLAGATATVRFSSSDRYGVSRFDLRYRSALPGQALGSWTSPASWQGLTSSSLSFTPVEGEDRCVAVRAWDTYGNVSAWSASTCVARPLDDRSLIKKGSVARSSVSGTTVSVLQARGASLTATGQRGKAVVLRGYRRPNQGKVEVRLDGVLLGTVSFSSSTPGWHSWTLTPPRTLTGTLTLKTTTARPASVDSVSFLRN